VEIRGWNKILNLRRRTSRKRHGYISKQMHGLHTYIISFINISLYMCSTVASKIYNFLKQNTLHICVAT